MYPAIEPKRLSGEEQLVLPNGHTVGSVAGFWRWAYSDLMGNAERGALAEYIVAGALGIDSGVRVSWDKYDLLTKEGIRVEVKTSGYLQTWEQKTLSKILFGIQPTYGWDSRSNAYDTSQKRQSDIYVFCVHKHTEQESVDPLQISQWEFYLMPTFELDKKFGKQKNGIIVQAGGGRCAAMRIRRFAQKDTGDLQKQA